MSFFSLFTDWCMRNATPLIMSLILAANLLTLVFNIRLWRKDKEQSWVDKFINATALFIESANYLYLRMLSKPQTTEIKDFERSHEINLARARYESREQVLLLLIPENEALHKKIKELTKNLIAAAESGGETKKLSGNEGYINEYQKIMGEFTSLINAEVDARTAYSKSFFKT